MIRTILWLISRFEDLKCQLSWLGKYKLIWNLLNWFETYKPIWIFDWKIEKDLEDINRFGKKETGH